jgi:pimeloyl-ACP methyl ester carboxylesterase
MKFLIFALLLSGAGLSFGGVVYAKPLVLKDAGVFFVGGEKETVEALGRGGRVVESTNVFGQSLVHFFKPKKSNGKPPIVMIPGLGLTSYIYLATPDGRMGWAQRFAKQGYDVYVLDPANTGISGFDHRKFAEVGNGQAEAEELPGISIWSEEAAWSRWGFGSERGIPYETTLFPTEFVDQFVASFATRIGGGGGRGAGAQTDESADAKNLKALLTKIGASTIMIHSMAGRTGFAVAGENPELVKAIVALEPVGCPTEEDVLESLKTIAFVGVYGDFIEERNQTGRLEACLATAAGLKARGAPAKVIELTKKGIQGNSHLMMQDKNSGRVARIVHRWLKKNL